MRKKQMKNDVDESQSSDIMNMKLQHMTIPQLYDQLRRCHFRMDKVNVTFDISDIVMVSNREQPIVCAIHKELERRDYNPAFMYHRGKLRSKKHILEDMSDGMFNTDVDQDYDSSKITMTMDEFNEMRRCIAESIELNRDTNTFNVIADDIDEIVVMFGGNKSFGDDTLGHEIANEILGMHNEYNSSKAKAKAETEAKYIHECIDKLSGIDVIIRSIETDTHKYIFDSTIDDSEVVNTMINEMINSNSIDDESPDDVKCCHNLSKNPNLDVDDSPDVPLNSNNTCKSFLNELQNLINSFSMENRSNTPDFILANYLSQSLSIFDKAINSRSAWYGESTTEATDE